MLRNSSWSGTDAGTRGHHAWDREAVLSLEDVSKEFPGVKALDKVRFILPRGEAPPLCGGPGPRPIRGPEAVAQGSQALPRPAGRRYFARCAGGRPAGGTAPDGGNRQGVVDRGGSADYG